MVLDFLFWLLSFGDNWVIFIDVFEGWNVLLKMFVFSKGVIWESSREIF